MPDDCQKFNCCGDESYTYDVTRATPNPPPVNFYAINLTVDPSDTGTTIGSGNWAANTFVTITATPVTGYVFSSWSGDIESNLSSVAVFMDSDKTIVANFTLETLYLTLSSNPDGSATLTGQGPYFYGDSAPIEAFPLGFFEFDNWSGDISSINNPESVLMDSDKSIVANLSRPNYELTININPVGSGSAGTSGTYPAGAVAILIASSDDTTFIGWTGDLVTADNPSSIQMDSNKTVTANFLACHCGLLTQQILRDGPTSQTLIKMVVPSPDGPPFPGYSRRKSCIRWVCACIGNNQTILSSQQYGGSTVTNLDLTQVIWDNVAIPSTPGTYVYGFYFYGWRQYPPYTAGSRGWQSSDTKYDIYSQEYAGITD